MKGKTLTGFGDDSVVTITGAETNVTITSSAEEKGKITGGNNLSNGGGFSIQDATVNLHNLSITENKAIGIGGAGSECTGGGGIYAKDANLTLDNVHVYENTADLEEHEAADGGGILSIGGALTIKNNSVIENNTAIDDGGGICASNTLVNIEASVIQDNHSLYGGGLYVTGKNSCTITQNTRIQNNRAEYMTSKQKETEFMVPIGGGIYCGDGLDLTIQNSTVALNIGGDQGGGIVAYSMGELTLDHAEITDNNASFGGGIFALCTAAANTHITLQNGSSINKMKLQMVQALQFAIYLKQKIMQYLLLSPAVNCMVIKQQMVMVVVFTAKAQQLLLVKIPQIRILMEENLLQIITVLLSATTKQATAVVFMELPQILYSPKTMHCITMLHKQPVTIYSHLVLIV